MVRSSPKIYSEKVKKIKNFFCKDSNSVLFSKNDKKNFYLNEGEAIFDDLISDLNKYQKSQNLSLLNQLSKASNDFLSILQHF